MTTDSQYSWPRFFMELADKLLAFKDDRQALIAMLQHIYAELGMDLPTLNSGGIPMDIDPFTVYGLFNRGLTDNKRRAVALGIGGALGVQALLHDDFVGVPTLLNINATFYDQARRDDGDIDRLWDLFTVALAYADQPTEQTEAVFRRAYDAVLQQRHASWNVTMGLFWIRPYSYVNLSKRDRWFLALPDRMPSSVRSVLASLKKVPESTEYLGIRDSILSVLKSRTYDYSSFPELSAYAWRVSEQVNRENKEADKEKEEVTQAAALGDADVETVRYWLYAPGRGACMWDEFYTRGIMGLAWGEIGDLTAYAHKEDLKAQMLQTYPENGTQKNDIHALWQFANEMKPGDVVFVKKGRSEILGRGIVAGDYVYDPEGGHYPNCREVRWTSAGNWPIDERLAMKTLTEITDYPELLSRIEMFFEDSDDDVESEEPLVIFPEYSARQFLNEVYMPEERYDAIVGLLRTKKNIIMQGAPGVGKTYAAKRLAYSMMGVKEASRVMLIQFHQSYSYEDFIEGYRPSGAGFELVKGAFYSFCKKAADDEENAYFFIIDEINRGNLSKIFGELFMLIESDKRGPKNKLQLLYSRELFYVPRNVHIIGMMNTADRSLAMLDYALRRRFAFVELRPAFDSDGFREYCSGLDNSRFEALVREVESLNRAIADDESLGEGFCIGHSYFCNMEADSCTDAALASIVDYELIPMLKEYWFDEPGKVREWSDRLRRSLR